MTAWYNEPDAFKAAVLREAIKAGAIADGVVDERSIKDVRAADLVGFTQCHFFAGGGFWSLALNRAGWGDREVWTGSCPCPSFSEAGKGTGFDDDRHLWPDWYPLIRERRPAVVFGEQSHAAIGFGWLDLVCGNMEASGYAVAPAVLGAHSVGAPHRRQRLYFVADAQEAERRGTGRAQHGGGRTAEIGRSSGSDLLGDPSHGGCGIVGDAGEPGSGGYIDGADRGTGPLKGFWRDCDWIHCRPERGYPNGRWRPVESGTFPLAHGDPCRLGRLRLYGDAINVEVATAFIRAYLEATEKEAKHTNTGLQPEARDMSERHEND